jgi:hypothetical protein
MCNGGSRGPNNIIVVLQAATHFWYQEGGYTIHNTPVKKKEEYITVTVNRPLLKGQARSPGVEGENYGKGVTK